MRLLEIQSHYTLVLKSKKGHSRDTINFPFHLSTYELDGHESIIQRVIPHISVLIFSSYLNDLKNKVGFLHITAATLMTRKA